jgi:N-sulfoglucosamine sulfohydrolase
MESMTSERPNILLLHCHDLGRFLGCYGVPTVRTPNLDALAADGVRFAQAYATAPQCSPSRSSLLTGRWPHNNGVLGLTHSHFAWDLHAGERHLGQELHAAGYQTTLLGVHHESRVRPDDELAARLGFDEVVTGGLADVVADRTVERLERLAGNGKPFYLQVGFIEPHRLRGERDAPGVMGFLGDHLQPDDELGVTVPPYLLDDEGARTEVAELQGAVRFMDAAAGRVLGALRDRGLERDTLVLFTTDHGIALPRAKCTLYDPGLEVAMIARWPGRGWMGGVVHDELISNLDVVPTLLEALGLAVGERVQGRSFLGLLDDSDYTPREEIFGELTYHDYYDPRRCVRTKDHKLIANFSSAPAYMDSSQSWKRRSTPKQDPMDYHPPYELYDLATDPAELVDLAGKPDYADVERDLLARLGAWMRETDDPLLTGAVAGPLHHRALDALLRR